MIEDFIFDRWNIWTTQRRQANAKFNMYSVRIHRRLKDLYFFAEKECGGNSKVRFSVGHICFFIFVALYIS